MMQQTISMAATAGQATPRAAALPRVETVLPAAIDDALTLEWSALAGRAAEANVFAEPWLAKAALACVAGNGSARLAVVREPGGALIGAMPLTAVPRLGRIPLRSTASWSHPNAFLTMACALAGRETDVWRAVLGSPDLHGNVAALQIDGLVEGGALHSGLIAAAADLRLPFATETRVVRAMLATDLPPDAYWEASVRSKKRKELRRQWARLAETGVLSTDHLPGDADPSPWIAEFLTLEASGWKGSSGSALASNADTLAYFTGAMREGHAEGQVLMTALRIDGRAIAMLITLVSGGAGFSFKTAFDESYARFSPGVLLHRESLGLLSSYSLSHIDSCAAEDHPMIDSLWRERRSVVAVSLPLPGAINRAAWSGAQAATRLWHGVKALRRPHPTNKPSTDDITDNRDEP
jgi:CelD/BcsL family acetyltransferase involved in cellulose biosynthesis